MKVLRKYWRQMSPKRHAWCYCVLELMERGYNYYQAKDLINKTEILIYAEKYSNIFFHYTRKDWANWVINWNNSTLEE